MRDRACYATAEFFHKNLLKGIKNMQKRDIFNDISPIDYRYWDEDVAKYLSENAFTRYKLSLERALARALNRRGICPDRALKEIERATELVATYEVYAEEKRIHHDIRALANCIRDKITKVAKPYVHLTATSQDIIDSSNAARFKDAVKNTLIPALKKLIGVLGEVTLREADTVQIGRTHGQHALPITFGFTLAGYISRIGHSLVNLHALAQRLNGKFSGAVGGHHASSILFNDPEAFEREVLGELGLLSAEHSTQIVPPEALTRLFSEITILAGILANLADDMRHLQRTEINEVGEEFEEKQVGSSAMPQKQNPINFENAKSCWKIVMPRIITVFMDQISEHQRDLTNSASTRTYGETIAYVVEMVKRLTRAMRKLKVNRERLVENLALQKNFIIAEPLSIILALHGHPDAHEKVRTLALQARREQKKLIGAAKCDPDTGPYFKKMTVGELYLLSHPEQYIGTTAKKARAIAERWKKKLGLKD